MGELTFETHLWASAAQRAEIASKISSWTVREEIPFIRAVRLVPRKMKEKLPAHFLGALDTRVRFPKTQHHHMLTLGAVTLNA